MHRKLLLIFILLSTSPLNPVVVEVTGDLNCTMDKRICRQACNEQSRIPYSATYCDTTSGNCICDCRDKLSSKCTFTPFTPCYSYCVELNPNPEVYLYAGGKCPVILNYRNRTLTVNQQCVCQCSIRMKDIIQSHSVRQQ